MIVSSKYISSPKPMEPLNYNIGSKFEVDFIIANFKRIQRKMKEMNENI